MSGAGEGGAVGGPFFGADADGGYEAGSADLAESAGRAGIDGGTRFKGVDGEAGVVVLLFAGVGVGHVELLEGEAFAVVVEDFDLLRAFGSRHDGRGFGRGWVGAMHSMKKLTR